MPVYCFRCPKCGACAEEQRPMSQSNDPKMCVKDGCGEGMQRYYAAEHNSRAARCDLWPMASDAAGVHPDDVPDMIEKDKQGGVPTEYTGDGNPVFTGPGHRRRYLQLHGMFDRNAGYSDPTPRNR